jgi:hypothetical protein
LNLTRPSQALKPVLTGLQQVPSLPSRIRANVDHAGPSRQPVLLKVLTRLHQELLTLYLNSNLLIAWRPATVAMEDGKHELSTTTKATTPWASHPILILH